VSQKFHLCCEGTLEDRRIDGGTNFIFKIKEQETRLTLHEHDDEHRKYVASQLLRPVG